MKRSAGIMLAVLVLAAAPRGGVGAQQMVWQADVSIRAFGVTRENATRPIRCRQTTSPSAWSHDARQ
jgi:hypothetical protein